MAAIIISPTSKWKSAHASPRELGKRTENSRVLKGSWPLEGEWYVHGTRAIGAATCRRRSQSVRRTDLAFRVRRAACALSVYSPVFGSLIEAIGVSTASLFMLVSTSLTAFVLMSLCDL
jgi:hypothetical protein